LTNLNLQNELFENSPDVNNGISIEANDVWLKFLEIVKLNVSDLKFNTWFKPIKAKSVENNTLLITVPSQDYYEMIISRFGDVISSALKMILGNNGKLVYEIEKETSVNKQSSDTNPAIGQTQNLFSQSSESGSALTTNPFIINRL